MYCSLGVIELSLPPMFFPKNILSRFFLTICICFFASCNPKFQKVLKSNDLEYKLEKAKEYYNEENYSNAIPLFEELLIAYKGQRDLEDIYYSYAYSHYAQGDYTVAAFHFKKFISLYPSSEKVEDAAFRIAECYHNQSPKYNLDQTSTITAIDQYQRFADQFPKSEKIPQVNEAIDELRGKLKRKAFESAYLYYKIRDYNAASYAFESLIKEFPDSDRVEEAGYLIIKSRKLYADDSYDSKKLERYNKTIEAYENFIKKYPGSDYLTELNELYSEVKSLIVNLQKS